MPISAHYGMTVLIWGLTWTAIRLQVESASVDLAVFYRFVMASVVALAVLAVTRRLSRLTPGHHGFRCLRPMLGQWFMERLFSGCGAWYRG